MKYWVKQNVTCFFGKEFLESFVLIFFDLLPGIEYPVGNNQPWSLPSRGKIPDSPLECVSYNAIPQFLGYVDSLCTIDWGCDGYWYPQLPLQIYLGLASSPEQFRLKKMTGSLLLLSLTLRAGCYQTLTVFVPVLYYVPVLVYTFSSSHLDW